MESGLALAERQIALSAHPRLPSVKFDTELAQAETEWAHGLAPLPSLKVGPFFQEASMAARMESVGMEARTGSALLTHFAHAACHQELAIAPTYELVSSGDDKSVSSESNGERPGEQPASPKHKRRRIMQIDSLID